MSVDCYTTLRTEKTEKAKEIINKYRVIIEKYTDCNIDDWDSIKDTWENEWGHCSYTSNPIVEDSYIRIWTCKGIPNSLFKHITKEMDDNGVKYYSYAEDDYCGSYFNGFFGVDYFTWFDGKECHEATKEQLEELNAYGWNTFYNFKEVLDNNFDLFTEVQSDRFDKMFTIGDTRFSLFKQRISDTEYDYYRYNSKTGEWEVDKELYFKYKDMTNEEFAVALLFDEMDECNKRLKDKDNQYSELKRKYDKLNPEKDEEELPF